MRTFRTLATAALLSSSATYAEALSVPIPGQNWKIEMDAPPIVSRRENNEDGAYFFHADAKSFTLFIFVNPPAKEGGSNKDCFDYYWTKASDNPHIEKNSVETTSNARYHRVQYKRVLKAGTKTLTSTNVNYYFVYSGKWIELEITFFNPSEKDSEIIEAFDKGLKYSKN